MSDRGSVAFSVPVDGDSHDALVCIFHARMGAFRAGMGVAETS
jgi:hypothetical protein